MRIHTDGWRLPAPHHPEHEAIVCVFRSGTVPRLAPSGFASATFPAHMSMFHRRYFATPCRKYSATPYGLGFPFGNTGIVVGRFQGRFSTSMGALGVKNIDRAALIFDSAPNRLKTPLG